MNRARSSYEGTLVCIVGTDIKLPLDDAAHARVEKIATARSITFAEALRYVIAAGLAAEEEKHARRPKAAGG